MIYFIRFYTSDNLIIISILCAKGVKWAFLDRVWSLQYESKASAFCKPKTSTATARGQKAHLALGAHHIFCNTSIVFRVFLL